MQEHGQLVSYEMAGTKLKAARKAGACALLTFVILGGTAGADSQSESSSGTLETGLFPASDQDSQPDETLLDPELPTEIHAYRIHAPDKSEVDNVTDDYIETSIQDGSDVIEQSFLGYVEPFELKSVGEITLSPADTISIDRTTDAACYSKDQLSTLARLLAPKQTADSNRMALLLTDETGACPSPTSTPAAFAVRHGGPAVVGFYPNVSGSYEDDASRVYAAGLFAHEVGHILDPGLRHESQVTINGDPDISFGRSDVSRMFPQLTTSPANDTLEVVRLDSGKADPYASKNTVMGSASTSSNLENPDASAINRGAFSTLDRALVLPEVFHMTEVDLNDGPIRHTLSFGPHQPSLISIKLPEHNIYQAFDPEISRLVVALEHDNTLTVTATSHDYKIRYKLPDVDNDISHQLTADTLYQDSQTGFSIIEHRNPSSNVDLFQTKIEVTDYQTGSQLAEANHSYLDYRGCSEASIYGMSEAKCAELHLQDNQLSLTSLQIHSS